MNGIKAIDKGAYLEIELTKTYFLNVNSNGITITDMDTDKVVVNVTHLDDVRMFATNRMNDNDELFASSSLDFPSEYTSSKKIIALANAIARS